MFCNDDAYFVIAIINEETNSFVFINSRARYEDT